MNRDLVERCTPSRRAVFGHLALLAAMLGSGAAPGLAQEVEPITRSGDIISVFGDDIHVPPHVRQVGEVVCIGGTARIEGEVSGNVVVVLGELELSGSVGGDVAAVLSDQVLHGARVEGQYSSVLGSLELNDATIDGEFVNVLSGLAQDAASTLPSVNFGGWIPGIVALVSWIMLARLLLVFLLLVLLVALAPERVRLIGEEAPARYLAAFFTGLLGYLVLLAIFVPILLSVVGIPFFFLAFWLLKWLGIAGVFFAFGQRLARSWGREMSTLGAVLGTFGIYAVVTLAPLLLGLWGLAFCALFRFAFFLALEVPAVGLLVLTRVGTRRGPGLPLAPAPAGVAPPVPARPEPG